MPYRKIRVAHQGSEALDVLFAAQMEAIQLAARPWHWPEPQEVTVQVLDDQPALSGWRLTLVEARHPVYELGLDTFLSDEWEHPPVVEIALTTTTPEGEESR
jgi:hypothetical protein